MEIPAGLPVVVSTSSDDGLDEAQPAVQDAAEVLARATADEAAANAARARYLVGPMPVMTADARSAAFLEPGEVLIATRPSAALDRRAPPRDSDPPGGVAGALYVTSRRLVLLGRVRLAIDLTEIEEAVLSGERVLLVLCGGRGVSIEASRPRVLRVEISAARARARPAGRRSSDAPNSR